MMDDYVKLRKYSIRMDLSLFADPGKTEQPTQKRKEKAREEGQVAKSQEIGTAFLFVFVFLSLRIFAPMMYEQLKLAFDFSIKQLELADGFFDPNNLRNFNFQLTLFGAVAAAPIVLVSMLTGVLFNLAQVGWHPTTKPLMPKFAKLNPASGFKRLFSAKQLLELPKSLLKFAIIGMTIYNTINEEKDAIVSLAYLSLESAVSYIGNLIVDMALNVALLYIFLAAADLFYQRWSHTQELKMTKQEVKEEWKQMEGNPQVKGKIKQKMREASMRRMMQDLPGADVIITNPTHFACALKYDRENGTAPKLIAKGQDFLALRIKEKAKEYGVSIVENKALARAIYDKVQVGQEIPPELYQAVAEILAYVYKLRNIA